MNGTAALVRFFVAVSETANKSTDSHHQVDLEPCVEIQPYTPPVLLLLVVSVAFLGAVLGLWALEGGSSLDDRGVAWMARGQRRPRPLRLQEEEEEAGGIPQWLLDPL